MLRGSAKRLAVRSFSRSLCAAAATRPQHVGILAMEAYIPQRCVEQSSLEAQDGVSAGKYVIGLGQERMAFVGDREDINSISMSVVSGLLAKYNIDPSEIGRVEVGTETILDKSKSTKTHLMELLGDNTNVEGVTTLNACYGGTAALLNSVAWVESAAWDGRYALVVCGDIAVYDEGAARPTGGCGAIAMLIGPDAPLPVSAKRHTHAEHAYDFYKPNLESEYPAVDGHLSNQVYLHSLDVCYNGLVKGARAPGARVADFDYLLFHSPYNKLVQKAAGRLLYNDFVNKQADPELAQSLEAWAPEAVPLAATYTDRGLDKALKQASADVYKAKCADGAFLSKQIGNSYSSALYVNLAALVSTQGAALEGKTSFCFSYGSGAIATAFTITARAPKTEKARFSCEAIGKALDLEARLATRTVVSAETFAATLSLRERTHSAAPYAPSESLETVPEGAYAIESVNEKHHRVYVLRERAASTEEERIAASG